MITCSHESRDGSSHTGWKVSGLFENRCAFLYHVTFLNMIDCEAGACPSGLRQIWGFALLTVVSALQYFRKLGWNRYGAGSAAVRWLTSVVCSNLLGTNVTHKRMALTTEWPTERGRAPSRQLPHFNYPPCPQFAVKVPKILSIKRVGSSLSEQGIFVCSRSSTRIWHT